MPEKRQPHQLRSLAAIYRSGFELEEHAHSWHQLLFARTGAMTLTVPSPSEPQEFVVPQQRAAWIPADVAHRVAMGGRVDMRTLYFHPEYFPSEARPVSTLNVSSLLRELILRAVELGPLVPGKPTHDALTELLRNELARAATALPHLPLPIDERALRVAARVREAPSHRQSLKALSSMAGASQRTLERLFRRETGLSFGRWRRRSLMLDAARRLSLPGATVEGVATALDYESTSAFIAAFREEIGTTPGRLLQRAPSDEDSGD
ncbi:MAG: helix-turn-helix transcriptional regulator [Acidobacteriota bacterium]